ncbi:MAG: hypothetical protein MJE68_18925, partial [Proteobacteria bacterium]|nr:hypothetical protein [Pseudomonadota bacterium]
CVYILFIQRLALDTLSIVCTKDAKKVERILEKEVVKETAMKEVRQWLEVDGQHPKYDKLQDVVSF